MIAGISGDPNPKYLSEAYTADTVFGGRIVNGVISASLLSTVLSEYLPGPGTITLRQDIRFLAPVRLFDTLTATCTVREKTAGKNRVIFACKVTNQDGVDVIVGETTVIPPKGE